MPNRLAGLPEEIYPGAPPGQLHTLLPRRLLALAPPELALIRSFRTADAADSFHLRGAEFRPIFGFPEQFGSHFPVRASCGGLLIVGQCICNPAVGAPRHGPESPCRQSARPLPPPAFRAVPRALLDTMEPPWDFVQSGGSVDCPVERHRGIHVFGAPVLLNGSLHLHWRERPGVRYHRILVFDMVAETFRHMSPPPDVEPCHAMQLLHMCGRLAASISKGGMTGMTISVLQDQEHHVWAFQYQIKLPVMEIGLSGSRFVSLLLELERRR